MNEKITILFKEINEVTKKIGEISLIENEDFYTFFKNLNFLEKKPRWNEHSFLFRYGYLKKI